MSYLNQFQNHLNHHDYPSFLSLWEEYCMGDEVDGEELKKVLLGIKNSELSIPFGRHVENAIPLWEKIKKTIIGHEILKLIFDLQKTNTLYLGKLAFNYLKTKYSDDLYFIDKIRLIGLRDMTSFQGAISNYELLTHMKKGNFVFHSGGWGVGEIIDVSFLREQLEIEFDCVGGKKDLSFENAFKTLAPIPDDHFLALRFGNPDKLEEKAKTDPIETIHILLRDLGPSTALEIKEQLYELVIPKKDWARWWQTTRSKIKKDTLIEVPKELRYPFKLRESAITHEEHLKMLLEKTLSPNHLIQTIYSFLRDFPQTVKNKAFKNEMKVRIKKVLLDLELTDTQEIQLYFLIEDLNEEKEHSSIEELVKGLSSLENIINQIEVIAFKKRLLHAIRSLRKDWIDLFLNLFLTIDQNSLREYILNELLKQQQQEEVMNKLNELLSSPIQYPQVFLWYFQKILKNKNLPLSNLKETYRFFESLLILLSQIEQQSNYRDITKKIIILLTTERYHNVRTIFQSAPQEVVQECLLLATKCQSLTDSDIKIFHSLAQVNHPTLVKMGEKYTREEEEPVIWTTEKGYHKIKLRIHEISTVETIDNAKEIEEARALGDLRENAEFKAALERRDRLQSELQTLSHQFNQARILTKNDIDTEKVGIGVVIDCCDEHGNQISYTLLGPWEADPDRNILSLQSKLAQSLLGHKKGDKVSIQGKMLTISNLRNYFETL